MTVRPSWVAYVALWESYQASFGKSCNCSACLVFEMVVVDKEAD